MALLGTLTALLPLDVAEDYRRMAAAVGVTPDELIVQVLRNRASDLNTHRVRARDRDLAVMLGDCAQVAVDRIVTEGMKRERD